MTTTISKDLLRRFGGNTKKIDAYAAEHGMQPGDLNAAYLAGRRRSAETPAFHKLDK